MHPDIIEIDAASNNGVDEVRDLIEKVKYAPISGKYKVYIIDEVHMMTSGAFNSLLKTLEEPPEHVVFILATTDVHKVIPTVLSRCQRFDFSKISFDDIKNRIIEILGIENITFEEGVPTLVAELADGGMRDALSILDQVVSYAGDHITLQHIYDIYGMMSNQEMINYLTLVANKDTKEVLSLIENYIGKGIDVKRLTYDLMICLKDAIVFKTTCDDKILERLDATLASKVLENYSIDMALKVCDILNEARANYRLSTNYRLFFEIASLKAIEAIRDGENTKQEESATKEKVENKQPIKSEPVKQTFEEVKPQVVDIPSFKAPAESEIVSFTIDEYVNILCHGDKKFKDDLTIKWSSIRDYINNPNTRYIAQLAVDSQVMAASKDFILLGYNFKLLATRARQKNNTLLLKEFINNIFGLNAELYVIESDQFIDIKKRYFDLRQANKLPTLTALPKIKMDEPKQEEKVKEEVDKTIELGRELFGDDLEID